MQQSEEQKNIREGRFSSILHEAISQFLLERANAKPFITISFVQVAKSRQAVTVYCSVFPKEKEEQALSFLKRNEVSCKDYLRKHTKLSNIPLVHFALTKTPLSETPHKW